MNEKFASYTETLQIAEKTAREETRKRNERKEAIKLAQAMKKEQKIREQATLLLAQKQGMVASSISKIQGESERRAGESVREGDIIGEKRKTREDEEMEQAIKEREELKRQKKREIERERRIEVAGKKKDKNTRD